MEQSERGAAMICTVHDDDVDRWGLAREMARAMLAGPWTAQGVAEAGATTLEQWPSWLEALALRVTSVHRRAPADDRESLTRVIHTFLAERVAGPVLDGRPPVLP
ncbi:MAG: hypothetical protein WAU75_21025, partial [Solirubrobacteraceae bacterium]